MSFHEIGFRPDNLVRLDIRINGEDAPPLATIVHRDRAHDKGKIICNKLKELIPRQQFRVSEHPVLCTYVLCWATLPNLIIASRSPFKHASVLSR